VRGEGGTGGTTEAGDDVDDTGGEASLLDQLGDVETRQGGLLGGLQDNCVAGGGGRSDLPGPHEQGEVPGDNLATDTDGLVTGVVHGVGVGVDGLAANLVGPSAVVTQATGRVGHVQLGHGQGLAVVQGFDAGDDVHIPLEEVGQLGQHPTSVGGGDMLPGALICRSGRLDGDVDILLGGLVDGSDDLLVVGVDGLEGLAIDTLDELVVDKPASILVSFRLFQSKSQIRTVRGAARI
jgi:hypothetical protein